MEFPAAERPIAELVVLNGRQKGNRCPLVVPLTLLGRDAACDVRLNLEGIAPFHVALVDGPAGPILRDLTGEEDILVNGQPVDNRLLQDGDVLTLGLFQFELCLPPGTGRIPPTGPSDEGLRIQAAAVAAEQVRLTELEIRLEQRRLAQETQEKQLVVHLDERHARLESLQQQVKEERQEWRLQHDAEEAELARLRGELAVQAEQIEQDRRRVEAQERASKDRQEAQRRAQESALAQREKLFEKERAEVERERVALAEERKTLEQVRLRLNTEMELGRRYLLEERETLHLDQQRWEIAMHEQERESRRVQAERDQQLAEVAQARAALVEEQVRWRKVQALAQKESQGLENRIRAQRAQLATLEREVAVLETRRHGRPVHAPVVDLPIPPATPVQPPAPEDLREVAAQLTDQRLHLVEQWQRLAHQQEAWEVERASLLSNLEEAAVSLHQRETDLHEKSLVLARLEQNLEQRHSRVESLELTLRLRQTEMDQERSALLVEVSQREEVCAFHQTEADKRVRSERRHARRAMRRLSEAREQLQELHTRYAALWQAHQEERRKLVPTQQEIARQRLALEKMRHEVLARAVNVAVAERKLERLEKEYVALWAREEIDLKAEWQGLDRERLLLNELAQQKFVLLGEQVRKARRGLRRKEQRRDVSQDRTQQRTERRMNWERLVAERDRAERQVEQLRAELERVAMNLMGEGEDNPPVAETQAA